MINLKPARRSSVGIKPTAGQPFFLANFMSRQQFVAAKILAHPTANATIVHVQTQTIPMTGEEMSTGAPRLLKNSSFQCGNFSQQNQQQVPAIPAVHAAKSCVALNENPPSTLDEVNCKKGFNCHLHISFLQCTTEEASVNVSLCLLLSCLQPPPTPHQSQT